MLLVRAKGGSKLAGHYTPFPKWEVAVVADVYCRKVTILYEITMTRFGAWKHRQSEL